MRATARGPTGSAHLVRSTLRMPFNKLALIGRCYVATDGKRTESALGG